MRFAATELNAMLAALDEQLQMSGSEPVALVVCGGTAMNALGFVSRPTQDVDVVALLEAVAVDGSSRLRQAAPLPALVLAARARVAADFDVAETWLNDGPAGLLDLGLPAGCEARLVTHRVGPSLALHYLSRLDLIYLKLYAWADTDHVRHHGDLLALAPTSTELAGAAAWVMSHNEPDGFLPLLQRALRRLGADDVAASLG